MKLNLGCGYKKLDGYVNVDSDALCAPDVLHDLEKFPWPFEDGSADEILLEHVLEHLGRDFSVFASIMKELYRVSAPDGALRILVPHPRHDWFLHDPSHVRVVTEHTIALFDQQRNTDDMLQHGRASKLGLRFGVDFEVQNVIYVPADGKKPGTISREEVRLLNNLVEEIQITARVVKPCRYTS